MFSQNVVAQVEVWGYRDFMKFTLNKKYTMTSFSHYPQHIEISRSQSENMIKRKFGGNLMYFNSYLTNVLSKTNFFALPLIF